MSGSVRTVPSQKPPFDRHPNGMDSPVLGRYSTGQGREGLERRLAAILAADVVGYSRLMGEDEAGTLARFKDHRAGLIDPNIAEHHGRIVKVMGDGLLVEFASVVEAVGCAVVGRT